MNILIIDDHAMFRDGLIHALLDIEGSWHIVGACDLKEAIDALALLAPSGGADVVLLDLELKEDVFGLDLIPRLLEKQPDIKIIIVSMRDDFYAVRKACEMDIQGFVSKDAPVNSLAEAIRCVGAGGSWYSQNIADRMKTVRSDGENGCGEFSAYNSLTRREQEIFEHLARGERPELIASSLGLSVHTVENYRTSIYEKLGGGDRLDLVNYARRLGLVS